MDWDRLRIFHAAAEAGSFTRAGEMLNMSQSAVSRQVSALEHELNVPLFHRHARGLVLTEQGKLLFRTAHEVLMKLKTVETRLSDSRSKPFGDLRVTTTVGLGASWLTARLGEFLDLYPEIRLQLLLYDNELDISMGKADVAIWLREPTQNDLIRRRLFTVHLHVYASPNYIRRFGRPRKLADLESHRILTFGGPAPAIKQINWLETAGCTPHKPRSPVLRVNSIYALKKAVQQGVGIAVLPDYMVSDDPSLQPVLEEEEMPAFDTYFVYPEELRNSKRVSVFRDFLLSQARQWSF